jgi:hypothetical protein
MIAYIVSLFSGWFGGDKKRRAAYDKGFEFTTAAINGLRGREDEYDPALVFNARARAVAAYNGSDKDFGAYQEGIRDAIVVYEREFGAP